MCGLGDNQRSHVECSTQVRTTLWNGFSSRDRWEAFTSNDVSSNSSSSTGAIGGFKGIMSSSTMTEFSPTSIKTKGVAETIWYLRSEGVDAFHLTN